MLFIDSSQKRLLYMANLKVMIISDTQSLAVQVPTLQTPEGGIWESNAIARYVARLADKGLFGATAYDAVSSHRLGDLPALCACVPEENYLGGLSLSCEKAQCRV